MTHNTRSIFTPDQENEISCNSYTAKVQNGRVYFTLAFKKFVMANIDLPGFTSKKVFRLAGYSDDLFTGDQRKYYVKRIRIEAASPEGLAEPKLPNPPRVKKTNIHSDADYAALQTRVAMLEQQVEFLKKSRFIQKTNSSTAENNSG